MKYIIVLILNLIFIQASYSQTHEFGVFLGGSNYVDDTRESSFINPSRFAYGGLYKWNITPRYSWRISGMTNYGTSNNKKSIGEISGGIEFNFLEFDLHQSGTKQTPYLYTGLSTAVYKDSYINSGGIPISTDDVSWTIGVPIIFGYKIRVSQSFIFGAEIGARYTFTDNLDGSVYIDEGGNDYSFGNVNNNDWYVFTGITVTYTFGRKPCYCD